MHRTTSRAGTALAAALALAACTQPANVRQPIGVGRHNDAKVEVKDVPGGFTVYVRYSRYQFIPETEAVLTACRSLATARAFEDRQAYVEKTKDGWQTAGIGDIPQSSCREIHADVTP